MVDQPPLNPGNRDERTPKTPYKFSPEEMQVMARCNKESFYQRSLPMSTILGLGTYWCVKSGYLKPSPMYGATLKVAAAIFVGYFAGKVSYHQRCAEYLMALPNSQVGEVLRRRRNERLGGGGFQDSVTDGSFGMSSIPSLGGFTSSSDVYSDLSDEHRYTDLDTERPLNDGLNDSFRPSVDYPALEEETITSNVPGSTTTYEELRRRNREEFVNKNVKPARVPSQDEASLSSSPSPNQYPKPSPSTQYSSDQYYNQLETKQKNAYGDVWEK